MTFQRILTVALFLILPSIIFCDEYEQWEYGKTSRQCGSPGLYYDWSVIESTAAKYQNPKIYIVTGDEKEKIQEDIRAWNEQRKQPRKGMDPCSSCSQEYEVCIVYSVYEGNVKNCTNWTEWRDDWDREVHAIIDEALSKFAFADPNSYTVHFRVRIGTDGKITPIAPPTGNWQTPNLQPPYTAQDIKDFAKNGPPTLSKIQNWAQEKLLKIQPCPFPEGTRVSWVERTPSIYHNVPGHTGQTPSPVPVEPR